jgi:hypothetical protein
MTKNEDNKIKGWRRKEAKRETDKEVLEVIQS